jgi:hypothetical protein
VYRRHENWLTLSCSLLIILAGGVTALACVSHPAAHAMAHSHPLLCLDLSHPVMQDNGRSVFFAEGRKAGFPATLLALGIARVAVGTYLWRTLCLPAHGLSWIQESSSPSTHPFFRVVLQL